MPKLKSRYECQPSHDLPREQPTLLRPDEVIAPGAGPVELLTRSPARSLASAADLAPPPQRPGQDTNLTHPSRFGDQLHYRSGLVTDLAGKPTTPQEP